MFTLLNIATRIYYTKFYIIRCFIIETSDHSCVKSKIYKNLFSPTLINFNENKVKTLKTKKIAS